jgi:hypothetical protein
MDRHVRVAIETGPKRVFATAIDWPGWSRGARTEDDALEALRNYGPRYAAVMSGSLSFALPSDPKAYRVEERVAGGSGTDFGIPSNAIAADDEPVDAAELERLSGILRACWKAFDAAAAAAEGIELRKGQRGGGRDLPKIIGHVREADEAYVHQLGAKPSKGTDLEPVRQAMLETLEARVHDRPIAQPTAVKRPWTPRYTVRRAAWHALDHAWEIEDRAKPEVG